MHLRFLFIALFFLTASSANAAIVWDEGTDGDISTDGGAPTSLILQLGSNIVNGSVAAGAGDAQDFMSFTIGDGLALVAINQLEWLDNGSGGPGNRGFHSIAPGPTSEVPGFANSDAFLGGIHMDPVASGTNLLPGLGGPARLSGVGFDTPLGPGTYTYMIQQTGALVTDYSVELVVAGSIVPEPSALLLVLLAALSGLRLAHRR